MIFSDMTPDKFEEYKKDIIKLIDNTKFDKLNTEFKMSLQNGILMGQHSSTCDTCDIFHYIMAIIIDTHRTAKS